MRRLLFALSFLICAPAWGQAPFLPDVTTPIVPPLNNDINILRRAVNDNSAAIPATGMATNAVNAVLPNAINNIIGGSSVGLSYGVIQTPSQNPGTPSGNVIAFGTGALRSRTPNDPACATDEYCAHVTAIGYDAGALLTTTDHIVALGDYACAGLSGLGTISGHNTCLGIDTARYVVSGHSNVLVGEHAGSYGGTSNTTIGLTAVGTNAGFHLGGVGNTAIGFHAMYSPDTTDGNFNTALGYQAARNMTGTATLNTALGGQTMFNISTGINNTAVGYQAGYSVGATNGHAFLGYRAGRYVGAGEQNTAIGNVAMQGIEASPISGDFNVAIGTNAMLLAEGVVNRNTAVGSFAGAAITTAQRNTMIGNQAAQSLTTGVGNVIIGHQVGSAVLTTGSRNILIGSDADVDTPAAGTSNTLNIDNIYTATGTATPSTSNSTIAGNLTIAGSLRTTLTVSAQTTSFAIAADGTSYDNTGAGAEISGTLPLASAGKNVCFVVTTAQNLRVRPNTSDLIYYGNTPTLIGSLNGSLVNGAIGSTLCLRAQSTGFWYTVSHEGTWTVI